MKSLAIAIAAALVVGGAYGHGGGLNSSGCHNQKGGSYHCHHGGGSDSGTGSTKKSSSTAKDNSQPKHSSPKVANNGKAERSSAARNEFVKAYPCPATGRTKGSCPGYHVDHIVPLACGGADAPRNMQWLSAEANLRKGSMGCRG
jgi:hypothetical protein